MRKARRRGFASGSAHPREHEGDHEGRHPGERRPGRFVDPGGFEPPTFSLRTRRATNCAMGPSENEPIIPRGVVRTTGGRRDGGETPLSRRRGGGAARRRGRRMRAALVDDSHACIRVHGLAHGAIRERGPDADAAGRSFGTSGSSRSTRRATSARPPRRASVRRPPRSTPSPSRRSCRARGAGAWQRLRGPPVFDGRSESSIGSNPRRDGDRRCGRHPRHPHPRERDDAGEGRDRPLPRRSRR